MQVKKQMLELDTEQWNGSKSGKEHMKAVYFTPCFFNLYAFLTYICEMPGWMKYKLESRFQEKY